MTTETSKAIENRYEFVLLFDVKDGNPNGDPDLDNMPRMDIETGHGLVTDVCIKRKIRNFTELYNNENKKTGYDIYIREGEALNEINKQAIKTVKKENNNATIDDKKQFMCKKYYDIRTFGAVMSTKENCGQVRGPIQITFARSINPISSTQFSITRVAVTTEAEQKSREAKGHEAGTFGKKHTVPYGLYRCHGFISPALANQTSFTQDDLEHFFTALEQMFDHDRSASKGEMATRALIIFKHESSLGNAPAHKLFDLVEVKNKDSSKPARSIHDYDLIIDEANVPAKVELIKKIIW